MQVFEPATTEPATETVLEARSADNEHETLMNLGFPAPSAAADLGHKHAGRLRDRVRSRLQEFSAEERGAVTAEYALVIMAAVAFAGLLITILRSDEVRAMLVDLVQTALGSAG